MTIDLDNLERLAKAATPQNIDSAQRIEHYGDGSHIECPACDGEGHVELEADFCNYDGTAIGVQFYGIGNEHGAAEAYFRVANPAATLELIAEVRRLREDAERYRWLRSDGLENINFKHLTSDTCDIGLDHAIDVARGAK